MSFLASCNYIDDPHGSYQLDPADLLSDNSLILSQIITDRIDKPNNPDRGKGYDDFGIELRIEKDESSNWYLDLSDNERFNAYKSYSKSKLSAVDTYIESTSGHGIIPPWLFDCGISEDVRIYSDVTLFGRPAGKDLSDKFLIIRTPVHNRLLCSWPDFSIIREFPIDTEYGINEYFKRGSALFMLHGLVLTFNGIPEERPNSFTITVEIPIKCNYWYGLQDTRTFLKKKDSSVDLPPIDRVLSGSVHIEL